MIALDKFNGSKTKLSKITLGKVKAVRKVSTDTRAILEGDLFVALTGENFDGNRYLKQAIEKGAKGCLFKDNDENREIVNKLYEQFPEVFFIGTDSTEKYFQDLASFHHSEWRLEKSSITIGITGSNGKTTTKELMAGVLESIFPGKTLFTEGNLNNHLGVPMTLLRLDESHDICILEMGTNHPGEISFLCEIGDPDAGIITSIGQSHLEFFFNEENVFREKKALYDYVKDKSGFFAIDSDNQYLKKLPLEDNLLRISFVDGNIDYKGQELTFLDYETKIKCPHLLGKHNFKNLAVVLSLLVNLFPEKKDKIFESAKEIKLPDNNRSQFIIKNGQTIFLDAYNANPSSMKAALESFKNYLSDNKLDLDHSLFVLGDMNELGEKSSQYHQELGVILKEMKVTNAIFVGRFAKDYANGFENEAKTFSNTAQLKAEWKEISKSFSSVFLKGSRTLQLESLMTFLGT
ncbi:MAG: UDP-N-acetylmuramoyl-tripeptide--D-alanyl-D-alanine ligase [Bacteriovoracaceae bacterium]|jgi:UDP-N-acetylmuramoyl-tripeptide--D-alanyl-D-alanine ligase